MHFGPNILEVLIMSVQYISYNSQFQKDIRIGQI